MIEEVYAKIATGDLLGIAETVAAALDAGIEPSDILNKGMISAMQEVGDKFENEEIYIPEMLLAAKTMQTGLDVLTPKLVNTDVKPIGKILIGTVKGDLHDIGKNLVGVIMKGSGFEVKDMGVDVTPEMFIEEIKNFKPDFVGLSALLTTTMPAMQQTIDAFSDAGIREEFVVMVGGAPVNQEFADKIGADLFAANAAAAAKLAKEKLAA